MLERRLHAAFDHVVCEVLQQDPPVAWSSAPCAYAAQALMREAAMAGDIARIAQIYTDCRPVLTAPPQRDRARVIGWGDGSLSPVERELLQAAFRDDIGLTAHLLPTDPGRAAALGTEIAAVLGDLGTVLPRWAQEFRALVAQIILADSAEAGFAGASAFAAWGAILVNPAAQADRLALLLTLIHESSHLKLFGAFVDDEVVLNDPDETFASPLRRQPRPMVGIYHAAFVLARIVCFLHDLRASGQGAQVLGPIPEDAVQRALQNAVDSFGAAHEVILAHGRLTALGRSIIDEASAAVQL